MRINGNERSVMNVISCIVLIIIGIFGILWITPYLFVEISNWLLDTSLVLNFDTAINVYCSLIIIEILRRAITKAFIWGLALVAYLIS